MANSKKLSNWYQVIAMLFTFNLASITLASQRCLCPVARAYLRYGLHTGVVNNVSIT